MLGKQIRHASCELYVYDCGWIICLSVDVFVCVRLYIFVYSTMRSHACAVCAVQTTFPTAVPSGVCCCCIPVCTTDKDFHSERPADGVYMCQPLQQITNPPKQKQNVPLSFSNFQYEEEAVGHLR